MRRNQLSLGRGSFRLSLAGVLGILAAVVVMVVVLV
jgi:hypothetical protein